MQRICVFCGANRGARQSYASITIALARYLAARKIGVVYGGGNVGLMGLLADTMLDAGGEVTGVIPHFLAKKEVAHTRLTDLRRVETMHARKALMVELADAFIALPGGYGTLDEFCEIRRRACDAGPCGERAVPAPRAPRPGPGLGFDRGPDPPVRGVSCPRSGEVADPGPDVRDRPALYA